MLLTRVIVLHISMILSYYCHQSGGFHVIKSHSCADGSVVQCDRIECDKISSHMNVTWKSSNFCGGLINNIIKWHSCAECWSIINYIYFWQSKFMWFDIIYIIDLFTLSFINYFVILFYLFKQILQRAINKHKRKILIFISFAGIKVITNNFKNFIN